MIAAETPVKAYLVTAADGYQAVFKDRAQADRYAAHTHGVVQPLGVIEKEPADDPPRDPA